MNFKSNQNYSKNVLSFLKSFCFTFLLFLSSYFFISCEPIDSFNFPWLKKQALDESPDHSVYYPVKWVSDGDTFWIDDGTKSGKKIRLIGIDAPESVDYGNKTKQEFGEEAHKFADSLLKDKKVNLSYDIIKYDKYGRVLAYAFLPDGTFVNQKIVEMGYAVAFNFAPNLKYADVFLQAEDSAVYYNRGLWAVKSDSN